jgi:hypothetical protein
MRLTRCCLAFALACLCLPALADPPKLGPRMPAKTAANPFDIVAWLDFAPRGASLIRSKIDVTARESDDTTQITVFGRHRHPMTTTPPWNQTPPSHGTCITCPPAVAPTGLIKPSAASPPTART